jgi:hypothetical protein
MIFRGFARVFVLQCWQTNISLYNLACAAGNFVAMFVWGLRPPNKSPPEFAILTLLKSTKTQSVLGFKKSI